MALTTPSMSPSITVREFDLTGVAPNVDTTLTGMVGKYKWGPVDTPILLGNEDELAKTFGIPDADVAVDYFSASQYLKYSGNLYVVRQTPTGAGTAVGDSAFNATIDGTTPLVVNNELHFESQDIDK